MRVLIKFVLVFALSAAAVVFGWRWLTGRYPPPLAAGLATLALFAALIALDAGIGW